MLGSGSMAPAFDASVQLFLGPRFGSGEYGYTVVSPFAEKWCCWVVDEIQLFGEVGTPAEGRDELFPGGRTVQGASELSD